MNANIKTVDEYIDAFEEPHRSLLIQMRNLIRSTAPQAVESISYGMPAYQWKGPLVYFGGFKNHIGFYPTALGVEAFTKELEKYPTSKGAVQFSLKEPLPLKLITIIVKARCRQNDSKQASEKKKK